ncbi:MAG: hypothetical protein ABFD08_13040 [Syntrophomonas sp.]
MSKKPSLFYQMNMSLRSQQRFGCSKHQAKQVAIEKAHAEGRSGFGVAPEGIFSIVTYNNYCQVGHQFSDWARGNGNPRTLDEAKPYVALYLQDRIARGLSAWTIARDRCALRKIFMDPGLAYEVEMPIRHSKDIRRSRYPVAMDRHFSEKRHADLVDFESGTGLRRHELGMVVPEEVYYTGKRLVVYVRQGKGGKRREVTVLGSMRTRIMEIVAGKESGRPMFPHIPGAMDVHSYRAEYAAARQDQDGASKLDASKDLGHNRIDVIRYHYNYKRHN